MRTHTRIVVLALCGLAVTLSGCSATSYRRHADRVAYDLIDEAQRQTLGRAEPFTIERPSETLRRKLLLDQDLAHAGPASLGTAAMERAPRWPEETYPHGNGALDGEPWPEDRALRLSLVEALQVAARSNRDYQSRKESVFQAALDLDLEANEFRSILSAALSSEYIEDRTGADTVRGAAGSGESGGRRRFENGTVLTGDFALDLAKLLTADRSSSLGILADISITVPLLRGSGRHVVAEPLVQAERNLAYALFTFERFKRTLAVRVATEYLSVLQQLDQVHNAEDNYRRLIVSTRRAVRLADAGRLPQIQVDQALQDELRARDRWIAAQQSYARSLDSFKITLGLPTDAIIELDRDELQRLVAAVEQPVDAPGASEPAQPGPDVAPSADEPVELVPAAAEGGRLEMAAERAIDVALANRLDLQTAFGRVYDAQRDVVVAADALRAELTLFGSGTTGGRRGASSAGSPNAHLNPANGLYTWLLTLDLPLERTAERNAYRNSFIALEQAVRGAQELEDQVKLDVRDALRALLQARESYRIQARSVTLAERRVESTELFLQAGRAAIRDVLEAEEALISAQNALTAALVNYRVAELRLQRDMGVLEVDEKGNWREYLPEDAEQ